MSSSHGRPRIVLALAAAATLAVAGTAFAVQTPFDDIDLKGDSDLATFEYGFDYACLDGDSSSSGDLVYSIEDGSYDGPGDAYDGALALYVDGDPFTLPSEEADLIGDTEVRSSTEKLAGLKISRTGTSFPGNAVVRELIKFQNPKKKKKISVPVTLSTEYGADSQMFIENTSSGDSRVTKADRWYVTGDDPVDAELSDPVVTTVNYGKGKKVLTPYQQLGPIGTPDEDNIDGADCSNTTFNLKVKGKQTRYLMFFSELNTDYPGAQADVGKFNKKRLNSDLLSGLSKSTKKKVANWDLG